MGSILIGGKQLVKKGNYIPAVRRKSLFSNTYEVNAMYPEIESNLFVDLQAQKPHHYCSVCGGCCYGPEDPCLRCERRLP